MKHIEKINYCFVFFIKIIILRPIFDKFWIMIKFMSGLALAAASLLMASCCSQPDIDGKWNIVKVNGEEVTVAGDEKHGQNCECDDLCSHVFPSWTSWCRPGWASRRIIASMSVFFFTFQ